MPKNTVIIKGSDGNFRLATPDEHEWWCPFGIQVELVRLDTESRKSSASSRKSCKIIRVLHEVFLLFIFSFLLDRAQWSQKIVLKFHYLFAFTAFLI